MPGPGGGSSGGGFGGGSRGGGFGGGNRGGFGGGYGHHHHHHGPRFYGPRFMPFFWGPRFYYGGFGGGFFGGLFGLLILPIILIIVIVALLVGMLFSAVGSIARGGDIVYNEEVFQDYANAEYAKAFSDVDNYEDNILIVFLTYEDKNGYECIAWVGDNIERSISRQFGDETTLFGRAVLTSINDTNYKYALTHGFCDVIDTMTVNTSGADVFITAPKSENTNKSSLVNYTDLTVNEELVEAKLAEFTEKTDIPISIVVSTGEAVFGKTLPWIELIVSLLLVAALIFLIVRLVQAIKYKRNGGGNGNGGYGNNNGSYESNGYGNYNSTGGYGGRW